MFETLSDISSTKKDTRQYTPDADLPLPVNKVGIEIEMEGIKDKNRLYELQNGGYWNLTEDHSLRGSAMELVSIPMFGKDVGQALSQVEDFFKKNKYKPTFNARTSLHVHMEVIDLSREELIRFIVLYCALEPILFNYCEESRKTNLYCLPISTIEQQKKKVAALITALEDKDRSAAKSHLKYWPK